MNQLIFIIIIFVVLVLFKMYHLNEKFESDNTSVYQNQSQQDNKDTGIYNYFYQQVLNPYKYQMTPFFSNDTQKLPKPSPKAPDY